jgi:hypothetical protein
MTRPLYETQGNLDAERAIVLDVERRWKCKAHKLPIQYKIDYALTREKKIVAAAEIKVRTTPHDKYPTYMLSLSKIQAAVDLSKTLSVPVMLIVKWSDVIGVVDLSKAGKLFEIGGRKDRDDWQDCEPVGLIPVKDFMLRK